LRTGGDQPGQSAVAIELGERFETLGRQRQRSVENLTSDQTVARNAHVYFSCRWQETGRIARAVQRRVGSASAVSYKIARGLVTALRVTYPWDMLRYWLSALLCVAVGASAATVQLKEKASVTGTILAEKHDQIV